MFIGPVIDAFLEPILQKTKKKTFFFLPIIEGRPRYFPVPMKLETLMNDIIDCLKSFLVLKPKKYLRFMETYQLSRSPSIYVKDINQSGYFSFICPTKQKTIINKK